MAIQFLSMREEWPKQGNVQESPSDTFINETQRGKKTKQNHEIKENREFRQKHPKITHLQSVFNIEWCWIWQMCFM